MLSKSFLGKAAGDGKDTDARLILLHISTRNSIRKKNEPQAARASKVEESGPETPHNS